MARLCFYQLLPYSHHHQLLTCNALHILYPSFLARRPSTIIILRTCATLSVDAPDFLMVTICCFVACLYSASKCRAGFSRSNYSISKGHIFLNSSSLIDWSSVIFASLTAWTSSSNASLWADFVASHNCVGIHPSGVVSRRHISLCFNFRAATKSSNSFR